MNVDLSLLHRTLHAERSVLLRARRLGKMKPGGEAAIAAMEARIDEVEAVLFPVDSVSAELAPIEHAVDALMAIFGMRRVPR